MKKRGQYPCLYPQEASFWLVLLFLQRFVGVQAFTVLPSSRVVMPPMAPFQGQSSSSSSSTWLLQQQSFSCLYMAKIRITTPSSDTAAEMGIREWPQQAKRGEWSEFVPSETTVVRYVLDGSGSLEIVDEDQAQIETTSLVPGTLIEVTGTASLQWSTQDPSNDMILLTPNFEQGGLLIGVVVSVITLFGALLAGVAF